MPLVSGSIGKGMHAADLYIYRNIFIGIRVVGW